MHILKDSTGSTHERDSEEKKIEIVQLKIEQILKALAKLYDKKKFPYHNYEHFEAVKKASLVYIVHVNQYFYRNSAEQSSSSKKIDYNNLDPLALVQSIKKYNREHQTNFNIDDLKIAFRLFALAHDLGNDPQISYHLYNEQMDSHDILSTKRLRKNINKKIKKALRGRNLDDEYLHWQEMTSEGRSKQIFKIIAQNLNFSSELIDLVCYLIDCSHFDPSEDLKNWEKPFWLMVQICDQVGGNLFVTPTSNQFDAEGRPDNSSKSLEDNTLHLAKVGLSLLKEMMIVNHDYRKIMINLGDFLNFIPRRIKSLLTLPKKNSLEGIWQFKTPEPPI